MLRDHVRTSLREAGITVKQAVVFGVEYAHLFLPDEGDLYLTCFGAPYAEFLLPCNWRDEDYYRDPKNRHLRTVLKGSSHPTRTTTKPVNGMTIDLVVKWCRVGQDVFLDLPEDSDFVSQDELYSARWNNPFEEIGLLMELRGMNDYYPRPILTQRPLAIFVPHEKHSLEQMQRSHSTMDYHVNSLGMDQRVVPSEDAIQLDVHRSYILIYQWIKGEDAVQAFERLGRPLDEVHQLTRKVQHGLLRGRGYTVLDTKPNHLIVRQRGEDVLRDGNGEILFALIDFELLRRTKTYEKVFRRAQRTKYVNILGSSDGGPTSMPEDRATTSVFGVDYVYGIASNQGRLWTIGRNPALFDYFDAARWAKTARVRLSPTVFRTKTTDNVHIVYRYSRVGMRPQQDPSSGSGRRARKFGFNSPFEEIAIAEELRHLGIAVAYPRGVYQTDHESLPAEWLVEYSRYVSHQGLHTPDGKPVLERSRDYYSLWGYWRGIGPSQHIAGSDLCGHADAEQALDEGIISEDEFVRLVEDAQHRLTKAAFLEPVRYDRLMLQFDHGKLVLDECDKPDISICVNGYRAFEKKLLGLDEYDDLLEAKREELERNGYVPVFLKGDHLILSMTPDGILKRDASGNLTAVLCNFEQIRAPWMNY